MTEPLPVSAEQVTAALRRCNALADGEVREVEIESARDTILSRITRLRLHWWNNVERVLLAFEDLGCRDLLT